jgi:ketosteroid isomerase-like protein
MNNDTPDLHASLTAAHHDRLNAVLKGDLEALAKVVGEDMIYVSSFGKVHTRADVIAAFQSGSMKIERMESYDISTRIYGGIGILIYQADTKMINGGDTVEGVTRSTTVYEMRGGNWLMISQHQSAVEAD